jgi:hypothetical protein
MGRVAFDDLLAQRGVPSERTDEGRLWVVIRDGRGGSRWQAYRVMVGG